MKAMNPKRVASIEERTIIMVLNMIAMSMGTTITVNMKKIAKIFP